MAEKLTPRVGDRVIFKMNGVTFVGNVILHVEDLRRYDVQFFNDDGRCWVGLYIDDITVVDREPVEWPRYPMWRYGDYSYAENHRITSGIWGVKESVGGSTTVTNEAASAISADDARKIGEAWLKVAEHWDDLTR